ncbi:hypothetical protein N5A93_19100, partial [Roseovarius sp. EGI FJ00037]|uniref:hypothetical protein n=1 Tax=Roseovarius salincola TaxID=2978479 RepID=UPI0022A86FD5
IGVSFLLEVLAGLITRHDTPPSQTPSPSFPHSSMRMDLIRSATSGWTAKLTGGGATRIFNFSALTPRRIDSWMVATGGGLTVQRGMKLTLETGTKGQPTSCVFDREQQDFSTENAAARAFLTEQGMSPPSTEFSPKDYFRAAETEHQVANQTRAGRTRHIRFLLGSGNSVLPAARGKTLFQELCGADPGDLDPPRRLLNFKYYPVENPDGYDVFAQIIDIETGKILAQAESKVVGRGEAALTLGMTDTVAQLEAGGAKIGPLGSGRAP